jgi:hypothetical protein
VDPTLVPQRSAFPSYNLTPQLTPLRSPLETSPRERVN